MIRDWTSLTGILLCGGILVLINLIGLEFFGRLDLTDDRVYSLSDASKDAVRDLEDPITITAYFSSDLPAQLAQNRRLLEDKLDDYRAYGGANVQYEFVDPTDDDEVQQEAARKGIPAVQVQVVEQSSVQVKEAYMGVVLEYESRQESIPVLQELDRLEYDLTSAIRRLTRESRPSVGFWSGHGEADLTQNLPTLQRGLEANYEVRTSSTSDLVGGTTRPDVLMVVSPADTIPDGDLQVLDQYIMDGGRVGFLVNRVAADLQVGQAEERNIGLEPLLASYGIVITPNLIMDEQNAFVTVQRQQGFFNIAQQIEYPLFPVASNFDSNNPMVNRLDRAGGVMFYYVSSIDTSAVMPAGVTMEPLIYSSSQSGLQQGFFMLQPTQTTATLGGGPYLLGAAFTGSFPSAYEPGRLSAPTRLVAIGDGDFIDEAIVPAQSGSANTQLALNMVDWLIADEALLRIRTKSIAPRQLKEVADGTKPIVKYANMIGPLLLVMLYGLFRWRQRKGRQIVVVQ